MEINNLDTMGKTHMTNYIIRIVKKLFYIIKHTDIIVENL